MSRSKTQLSVTVSSTLVADVEREVRRGRYPNRSAAVEAALAEWARRRRAAAIHAYYDEASPDVEQEEREWASLGRRSLQTSRTHSTSRKRRR